MTEYDDYPGHPLEGVPQATLDVAREVLKQAVEYGDVVAEEADAIADSVVSRLAEEGLLK